MKLVPIKNIETGIKKLVKSKITTDIKPIKTYAQYLKAYGIK